MKDKIILITGANRGIGHNILQIVSNNGYTVIGTSRSESGLENISNALENANGEGMIMDVTNQESIDKAVNNIKEKYGVIYGLVNNAGITQDNLLMRMTDKEWSSVIDTNLTSLYRVTRSVVKDMMKAKIGRIINIGSIVGLMGNAGQSNYSATKAGLLGFTKSLARELSSRNINVNSVSPGFIETDMTKALSSDQIEKLTKNIPLGRIASPEEVSNVIKFLLSDESSYITGENINVNGGLYM